MSIMNRLFLDEDGNQYQSNGRPVGRPITILPEVTRPSSTQQQQNINQGEPIKMEVVPDYDGYGVSAESYSSATITPQSYTPETSLFDTVADNQLNNPTLMTMDYSAQDINGIPNVSSDTIPKTSIGGVPNARAASVGKVGNVDVADMTGANIYAPDNAEAGQINQYFDPATLRDDIFAGIEAQANEDYNKAYDATQNLMANMGVYRSGINLDNVQKLQGERMDAMAKAKGDVAMSIATLQQDAASQQAALDTQTNLANMNAQLETAIEQARLDNDIEKENSLMQERVSLANQQVQLSRALQRAQNQQEVNLANQEAQLTKAIEQARLNQDVNTQNALLKQQAQIENQKAELEVVKANQNAKLTTNQLNATVAQYNAEVQNAFKTANFETLMNAAAQDQDAINQAAQYNIEIQSIYDEIKFKWMTALLDEEIKKYIADRDYQARLESIKAG